MAFARIAVNIPALAGVFDYRIPPELEGRICPGHLVTVPFGRQSVQGVVLELAAEPSVAEVKPLASLLDPLPVLTFAQLELARRIAAATLTPLAAMIDLMLPAGLSQQADTLFSLPSLPKAAPSSSPIQKRLLDLLAARGPLRGRQIDRHFRNVDWRRTAQVLLRSGQLASQSVLPPPTVRPKYVRTAQLAVPPETAEAALPELGRTAATLQRRQATLS
jgi:primosomal protein N' (replication factor Y)